MDEPGTPLPEGWEPKRACHMPQAENDMDMVIGEAFANMDEDMEDMEDEVDKAEMAVQVDRAEEKVNNLIYGVVNEVNLGAIEADMMESRT